MQRERGQTVVEVLLAAAVVAVALTTLVAIVTTALSHNRNAQERITAIRQAQEAIELVRAARDSYGNWEDFYIQQLHALDTSGHIEMCFINPLPFYDIEAEPDHGVTGSAPGIILDTTCAAHTYSIGNTAYSRKVTIDYTSVIPRSATIAVVVSWGSRPDSVTMNATLNEKD